MKIYEYLPRKGAGITASEVMRRIPDHTAELDDVREALRWAILDGKAEKIGMYYWRRDGRPAKENVGKARSAADGTRT